MSQDILVICDGESEYANLMSEYIRHKKSLPWEIHTYTTVNELVENEMNNKVSILAISETGFEERVLKINALQTVILNESGVIRWPNIKNINKYQDANLVINELLDLYIEYADSAPKLITGEHTTKYIGLYSPVKRCFQTSFAILLGEILARNHKVLYLNFEYFGGISEFLPDMQTRDLSDLLFFMNSDRQKFSLRMQSIVRHKGYLDYVPPMKAGQNMHDISTNEWLELIKSISDMHEYEYVIMDLSESVNGLFDILRLCSRVYTIVSNDAAAIGKLNHYEQILMLYQYEDVYDKTCRCELPRINKLPRDMEQLTKGDFYDYVNEQAQMLEKGG